MYVHITDSYSVRCLKDKNNSAFLRADYLKNYERRHVALIAENRLPATAFILLFYFS